MSLVDRLNDRFARFRMHWWKIVWGGMPYYVLGPVLGLTLKAPIMYWIGLSLALLSRCIIDIVEMFFETYRPDDAKYKAKRYKQKMEEVRRDGDI